MFIHSFIRLELARHRHQEAFAGSDRHWTVNTAFAGTHGGRRGRMLERAVLQDALPTTTARRLQPVNT